MVKRDACSASMKQFFSETDFLIPGLVEQAKIARRLGDGRTVGQGYVRYESEEKIRDLQGKQSAMAVTLANLVELRAMVLRNCDPGEASSLRGSQFRRIRD